MSARIAGVNIPVEKHIRIGLRSIYGIGSTRADKLCVVANINPQTKTKDLSEEELERLRNALNDSRWQIEGDLRREVQMHIKHKLDLGCYQGIRHRRGLPVRGQRTKTNSRTRKGKRKSVRK